MLNTQHQRKIHKIIQAAHWERLFHAPLVRYYPGTLKLNVSTCNAYGKMPDDVGKKRLKNLTVSLFVVFRQGFFWCVDMYLSVHTYTLNHICLRMQTTYPDKCKWHTRTHENELRRHMQTTYTNTWKKTFAYTCKHYTDMPITYADNTWMLNTSPTPQINC